MGGGGSTLRDRRVVIVGGGYGGVTVAMGLKGKCQLTLIDSKDHFFHNIGALRACVQPGFTESIFIPYAPSLGNAFLQGRAKRLDLKGKKVVLDGGKSIPFDYLVLATGSSGPFPGKLNSVAPVTEVELATEMYQLTLDKIKSAEIIVIIGGGAVGVELAGEIATDYPGKNVTIIHSNERGLIEGKQMSNKFRNTVKEQLTKLKVNVLIGERVVNMDDLPKDGFGKCKVKTDARKVLDADLVFNCTGLKTNADVYSDQLDDKMDESDCLRVNNFLQVEGQTDIYAVGDCCNADDLKTAYTAGLHADLVVRNLQLAAAGKNYRSYKPGGPNMIVSVGRHGGVAQIGSKVLGSLMAKKFKSHDLLVSKYWKLMKQVSPGMKKGAPQRAQTVKGGKQAEKSQRQQTQQGTAAAAKPAPSAGKRTTPSAAGAKPAPSAGKQKMPTTAAAKQRQPSKSAPPVEKQKRATQQKKAPTTNGKQPTKQKSKKK